MTGNHINLIQFVLKKYKIKFSNYNLKSLLLTNPNSSNFFGLSQIFIIYGFRPIAQNLTFDKVKEKRDPFFAYLINPEEIVVVTGIKYKDIDIVDGNGNCLKESVIKFLKRWSGNVLFLEREVIKHEKNLFTNKILQFVTSEKKHLFAAFFLCSFSIMLIRNENHFFNSTVFIINFIGLLLSNQISGSLKNNEKTRLCEIIKSGDCKQITENTAFLGIFKYDRIGIVFFSFFCSVPIYSNYTDVGGILILALSLAISFSVYSIFYQKYIARAWCILCLLIQACIALDFLAFFIRRNSFEYSLNRAVNLFIPVVVVLTIANFYFLASDHKDKFENAMKRLNRFIANDFVFESLLDKNFHASESPNVSSIAIGNKNDVEISLIVNPFCRFCKEAYVEARMVISCNDTYALKIIYLHNNNKETKDVCLQFLSIFFLSGEKRYLESVNAWYDWGIADRQKWKNTFCVERYELAEKILYEQNDWAVKNGIDKTPVFLINNVFLPTEYDIKDLNYI